MTRRYSRKVRSAAVIAVVLGAFVDTTLASSHLKLKSADEHAAGHRRHAENHFDVRDDGFSEKVEKRATNYFDFQGPQGGLGPITGQVPLRKEINTFAQDKTALNLFLIALERMMATSQSNSSSYYQIAGIHGRPYKNWDGVTGPSGSNTNAGYCTHADILFPTWHRPYMALYEQILYNHVQIIAKEFRSGSDASKRHLAAAPGWRMPYWDWAQNANVPDIANQPTVSVEKSTGTTTISNPLYSYKFKPLSTSDFPDYPYNYMTQTYRNPAQNGNSFVNQPDDLNAQLQNIATNMRTRVYTMLTAYSSFASFSNKATTTVVNGQYDSLESIHDTIHGVVGGNGGHMGAVDYAAFDPLFFLHHTNIDRIFAIWQAINPTAYTISSSSNRANFFMAQGTSENLNTPLMPFHQSDSTYYTSNTAKNCKQFGYTYPELVDWSSGSVLSANALRSQVIGTVNKLYGDSQPAQILSSASAQFTPAASTAPVAAAPAASTAKTSAKGAQTSSSAAPAKTTAAPAATTEEDDEDSWSAWNNWMFATANKRELGNPLRYRAATVPVAKPATKASSVKSSTAASATGNKLNAPKYKGGKNVDDTPPVAAVAPWTPALIKGNAYQDYVVNVAVDNAALNGTFTVFFFLGKYDTDANKWATSPNLIGSHSVFAPVAGGHSVIVSGSIPLTQSLINRVIAGDLPSLNVTNVAPFLASNLNWKVKKLNDEAVYSGDVSALQVQVNTALVQMPKTPTELPIYGTYTTLYNVTENKAAGLTKGDTLGST